VKGLATGRMGIGLIGSLAQGAVIASGLAGAGHALVARAPVDDAADDHVSAMLPGVPVEDAATVARRSELVILAADGDDLTHTVNHLSDAGAWISGQLVCHLGVSHGLDVLAPATSAGAIGIRLLPLIAFTGTSIDLGRMREAWCVVSAPAPVLPIAQALAIELGMEPLVLDDAHHDDLRDAVEAATTAASEVVTGAMAAFGRAGFSGMEHALAKLLTSSVEAAVEKPSDGWLQ
jgi:predicted short-subunit dehydrogenase-like oxidoreductase (DUF2520 family)